MPTLGDYLGCLMSEITNARLQADLASVRIAELYASHPLLKKMSVPRFKLPTIRIDVPVAVDSAGDTARTRPSDSDWASASKEIDTVLTQAAASRGRTLGPDAAKELKREIDALFAKLQNAGPLSLAGMTQSASEAAQIAEAMFAKGSPTPAKPAVSDDGSSIGGTALRKQLFLAFSKLVPAPPKVEVIATTMQLKDAGLAQNLMRLQLSITEEGVEWSQTNPSDSSSATLIPE